MKAISGIINGFGKEEIAAIERDDAFPIEVDGETITLSLQDVEITSEDIPGWLVASENGLTVALDITLTEDLKKEGLSRDMVNRIQNLRKDQGLEVQDKIAVTYYSENKMMMEALAEFGEYVKTETQALSLQEGKVDNAEKFDIDGVEVNVKIEVVK